MIRKRILLASLLKPVSDTRLFEKIGLALAQMPQAEVHVAGFRAPLPGSAAGSSNLHFHPVFHFKRLSWGRLKAQRTYWKLLQRVKPHLLIVGTHELLPLSWWYCRANTCKLVYDVQENYFLNLTTQEVYGGFWGKLLGQLVRGMEKALAPRISHFFLAERSYAQELPFLSHRYTILENKYLPVPTLDATFRKTPVKLAEHLPLRLLYSGTISRLYGVREAVAFTRQLRQWVPQAELTIIGYSAETAFLEELRRLIAPLPFVQLMGGDRLVPHQEIVAQEQLHHIGLLPYRPHPSTFSCIPTKLYEYLGNGLVIITEENPLWQAILEETNAGVTLSFAEGLTAEKVEVLLGQPYYQQGIPPQVFWREEADQVRSVARALLNL
ncbi:glycosyltransferase [Rufibacter psychrotolerans]|uniref:glycosyltransferase n=1 Tax=Rufibacter psychrotolerans TaxID=2812556 RepID=UPI0019674F31|nr:glycosyltransferase [Rufibacter sp. SYSU D00308]